MVSSKHNPHSSSTNLPSYHTTHSSSPSKYSPTIHHTVQSHNQVQSMSAPSTSTNTKLKAVSFPAPSPPRSPTLEKHPSSSMSSQSLASLTPSMSPSSIISLQRSARQEKRHHIVYKTNEQQHSSQKGRKNRSRPSGTPSSTRYNNNEKENPQVPLITANNQSTKSPQSSSINRFSKWASSIRHSLSSSSPSSSPSTSTKPIALPFSFSSSQTSLPASLGSSTSSLKPQRNSPLAAAVATATNVIEPDRSSLPEQKTSSNSSPAVHNVTQRPDVTTTPLKTTINGPQSKATTFGSSFSSSFSDQPRIRILNQNRRKKVGSGLITVFCVIAIVILFLC